MELRPSACRVRSRSGVSQFTIGTLAKPLSGHDGPPGCTGHEPGRPTRRMKDSHPRATSEEPRVRPAPPGHPGPGDTDRHAPQGVRPTGPPVHSEEPLNLRSLVDGDDPARRPAPARRGNLQAEATWHVSPHTEVTEVNPGIDQAFPLAAPSDPRAPHVRQARVRVDASQDRGTLARIWESIGYDELNWTYTPTGRSLLKSFGGLSDRGFLVRPHYVFCSGTGFGIPHWGNGNVYHEDADGNPFYDFTIADQTYDAIVEAGHHVL